MNAKSTAQLDLGEPTSEVENETSTVVSNETVASLITTHCVSCHSRTPTDEIFKVAPLGVVLDSWEDVERFAPQVVRRTTVTKDMPFLNKTKMTEEERQIIARWFAQRQE
jgi:uncharacterized membrane protein